MEQYYVEVLDTIRREQLVDEVTALVFESDEKEHIHKIISSLVDSLVGGFNAYTDIDAYLDNGNRSVNKYWQEAQRIVFDGGNAGWAMCVKEMLEIMDREIENLKSE